MLQKHRMLMCLAGLACVLLGAATAQAQVRVGVGVGGRGGYPGNYGRGISFSPIYFGPSYLGPSYIGPWYLGSSYYPAPYVYAPPGYYPPPRITYVQPAPTYVIPTEATSAPAHIRVLLPDVNAQVWFDGTLTKQTGLDRMFHTSNLAPGGDYSYRIRAAWTEKNTPMIQERAVTVTPGQTSTADFRGPVSEPLPSPK